MSSQAQKRKNSGHIHECQHDLKIGLSARTVEIYKSNEIAASLRAPHLLSPTPGQTGQLPLQKGNSTQQRP